jgi:hypothetical protein
MLNMVNNQQLSKEEKKVLVADNFRSIAIYTLSLSVALGFNDLVTTIFNSFRGSKHIIAKTIYVIILFGITLLVARWLSGTVNE